MNAPSVGSRELGVLLKARKPGALDMAVRFAADFVFTAGVEWDVASNFIDHVWLGDATGALTLRDQMTLFMECRRVLTPGGRISLPEDATGELRSALVRCAELVGLVTNEDGAGAATWTKSATECAVQPLVSILIPSSNPRYFAEALDSAIAQTWSPCEIIICDDCETDAIEEIVAARTSTASIRYIKNPERLRARKNYEKLLSLAQGSFLKFLNDDDVLEPDCVETLLRPMLANADITLSTSHRWRIDDASHVIDDMPATREVTHDDVLVDGITLGNAVVMYGLNFIGEPSTALLRKTAFAFRPNIDGERPFHFNGEEVRGAVDLAMWSRALLQGNAAFIAKRLSRFRIHGEQAQARNDVLERSINGIRNLQAEWIKLGLFRRYPPHLLRSKRLAETGEAVGDWHAQPVLSFEQPPESPERAIATWRATRRHAFDTIQLRT